MAYVRPAAVRPRALRASRGQALVVVVILMFVLAGLAGVFIALINSTLVQTAKAVEREQLEKICQAGLEYAKEQLFNSPDGADWRPSDDTSDIPEPGWEGWKRLGNGFYKVSIGYGPQDGGIFNANPLDKYLRIDVSARLAEPGGRVPKPYLERNLTSFVPLGLPDYGRWITNADGRPEPVTLGASVNVADPLDPAQGVTVPKVDPSALTTADIADVTKWTKYAQPISYLTAFDGPIRSEVSLDLGTSRLDLWQQNSTAAQTFANTYKVQRRDTLEVVGSLRAQPDVKVARVLMDAMDKAMDVATAPQTVDVTDASMLDSRLQGDGVRDYVQTQANNPLIRKMRAPELDHRDPVTGEHRYRALTRDSVVPPGATRDVLGWGEGIYLNNAAQLQYARDVDALRQEWLNPGRYQNAAAEQYREGDEQSTADGCWWGRYYRPTESGKATTLILHDWEIISRDPSGDASKDIYQAPYIEALSTEPFDGANAGKVVTSDQATGATPLPVQDTVERGGVTLYRVRMPYPRNGVIFAEGNLAVQGTLASSRRFQMVTVNLNGENVPRAVINAPDGITQAPGGAWQDAEGRERMSYYRDDYNRRFDLTIVSGGTIYIEGNLLTPASRKETYSRFNSTTNRWEGRDIIAGSEYDSKLALLAMDNVCLNPTRLIEQTASFTQPTSGAGERFWRIAPGESLPFQFSTSGPITPAMRILLRHAADPLMTDGGGYSALSVAVRHTTLDAADPQAGQDQLFSWIPPDTAADKLFFCTDAVRSGLPFTFPDAVWRKPGWQWDWLRGFYDLRTALPVQATDLPLSGYGSVNTLTLKCLGTADYLLGAGNTDGLLGAGFLVTPMDVQVDALIYAQRGSWFVIPGKYYNGDAESTYLNYPFPKYDEPLDVRIVINGAIAENRPAPAEMEAEWVRHWRGADASYFDADGNNLPDRWDPANAGWDADTRTWANRRMGIEYHYDATLARPVCYDLYNAGGQDLRAYRPRLPKLPASPNVYSISAMTSA